MQKTSVFRCEHCGNIVEMVFVGGGKLVCCGQPMTLLEENTVDAALEKHVPMVEKIDGVLRVQVGSVAHPMEEKHYIQMIEVTTSQHIYRKWLKPGEDPVAEFHIEGEPIKVREYCNLHGLWSAR
ncbi:desulfoferrodoxin [candidate division KSB1 bacterium]|nr:desulfoferrodoxin [candidate division KSB1 bacterium]